MLKEGGVLLLTTPTPKSSTANYPNHISIKDRNEWIYILKNSGFQVKICTYEYPINAIMPIILKRIIGRAIGTLKKYFDVTSTKLLCVKT